MRGAVLLLTTGLLVAAAAGAVAGEEHAAPVGGGIDFDLRHTPIDRFSAMVDRPLFSPTRRATGEGGLGDGGGGGGGPLRLKGVVLGNAGQMALLANAAGKTFRLAVGESAEGWTLTRLTDRAAELTKDGNKDVVRLLQKHEGK